MRSKNDRLQVMYCIPGRNYPLPDKHIIAKVKDGKDTHFFTFGIDHAKQDEGRR